MITIFCTPKNFENIFDIIQKNAIRSWRALDDNIEIIIFGESNGVKIIANEVNAINFTKVKLSTNGVPVLSDLFIKADEIATNDILVFINSDIILPPNFFEVLKKIKNIPKRFLMVGHRWDCDIDEIIDFGKLKPDDEFWINIFKHSKKHAPSGIDYFIYRRQTFKDLPNFIVGRPGYDNWIIWNARRRKIPVIDLTYEVKVFHQNHHFKFHNIKKDPKVFVEEDGANNLKIIGNNHLNLLDSNFLLKKNKIIKNTCEVFKNRNLGKLAVIYPEYAYILNLYKRFIRRIKK
jgi:hypothetical protein